MKRNLTVRRGALEGVETFLSVAQHQSFRRAAAALGVTEAGERFLSRAKPAFEDLAAAGDAARDLGQRPSGLLRLSVPRAVVPLILEPMIASFCQAYPEVELEIATSAEMVDLVADG